MKKKIPRMKRWAAMLGAVVLSVTCLAAVSVPTWAAPGDEVAQPEEIDLSLYDTQTALTAYVSNVLGVNGNDKHDDNRVESPMTVGNAGAYVGYGDEDKGFSAYVMSNLTHGTSTSTYDAWLSVTDGSTGNEVYAYTRFGHVLEDAGLDEVGSVSQMTARGFVGMIGTTCYLFAQMIPLMFGFALKLLSILNPFGFLGHMDSFVGYWHDAFPTAPAALNAVVDWVSWFFDFIRKISWAGAVPLLIGVAFAQVLLLRKKFSTTFGNVMKKIVFIAIGLPICAGLYTNVVDDMFLVMTHNTAGSQVVAGSLLDFEAWVEKSRLAIPAHVTIESAPGDNVDTRDISGGKATDDMLNKLRVSAYSLNKTNHDGLADLPDVTSIDSLHFAVSGNLWDGSIPAGDDDKEAWQGLTSLTEDTEVTRALSEMLWRYTTGSFYRASDFESEYKNWLSTERRDEIGHAGSTSTGSSNQGTVYEMFDRTNEVDDWMERPENANQSIWTGSPLDANTEDGRHMQWVNKDWNIYNGGSLISNTWATDSVMKFSTSGNYGLSPQSMYNYLSTSFDDTSVMVYSNDKSISENSRQQHYAVNIIGSGGLGIAYSLNMIALLAILVIIAFVFSMSMVIRNVKQGFSMLGSVPFALLGVAKSVAQVIMYTLAMIMELVISAFMYLLVSDLLVLVAIAVEEVVARSGSSGITVAILAAIGDSTWLSGAEMLTIGVVLGSFTALLLLAGMLKYRRAWFHVRGMASEKLYALCTFPETEAARHMVVPERESLPIPFGLQVCRYLA